MHQFLELVRAWLVAARQRLKALPLWINYAALLILVAVVAGVLVWRWGFRQQIDTGLIATTGNPDIENLWFLPDGTLVGTPFYSNFKILLWREPNRLWPTESRYFDVSAFLDFLDAYQASRYPAEAQARTISNYDTAVMRDGQKLVMYYDTLLAVFPSDLPPEASTRAVRGSASDFYRFTNSSNWLADERVQIFHLGSDNNDRPNALTITDNGLIALAYDDGRVEFRNPDNISGIVGGRKTNLNRPTLMKPLGNFLAVVSVPNASVVLLDVNSARDTPLHGYPPAAQFKLAISDTGRLAVSNGSNEVFLTKADGSGDANIPLKAYGRINSVSFFDDDRVIVGGQFQDVYLLSPNQVPYKLAAAPKGVNALAVSSNRIAFAGADGLVLLWHTRRRVLNRIGWSTVIVFGLFSLATLAFYNYDYRQRLRRTSLAPEIAPAIDEPRRLPLPDVPPALVNALQAGECILYCGSGISAQAGFPYWQPFIDNLTEWTIRNGFVNPTFGASLRAALAQGQYDSVSDNLVSIWRDRQPLLNQYLRETFLNKTSLPNSISRLKDLPLSAVMTTNFDNLLEQALGSKTTSALTPADAEVLLQCLHKREFFLLKLYGTLEKPATVILSPSQYEDVVKENLLFSQFMETLLVSRTILFVGASLEGIEAYLKGMRLLRQSPRTHYALIGVQDDIWQAKAYPLKERFGIEVLPYTPSPGHPELQQFLENIETELFTTHGTGTAVVDPGTILKRLSLTNVGPFENLELTFDRRWNILLGDNGTGKSSIIKAIAIAILGEDSKSYAHRIIKSGKPNSVITLETGRNTYTTKLFRKNGEAQVESVPSRAFEAEGWLVIGFPPLRTVSWVRPKAAESDTTGRQRPTPEDVLPVIVGEADPRLDKLKQWIVNVDYQIKDAISRKEPPDEYERLLKDFFDVVGKLTTDTKIKFKEVNAQTKEITIITDDGELPIEALSQGMTSLIGWVGILLQRMYEVYGADKDPKQHYALVLMDEIDAHLHPAWQQTLIRNLGKIFPKVQFIATTHSPLIVSGMKPEQIIRFARDDNDKVVTYKVEEQMTIGRADQILASDLFGLQSTMTLNEDLEPLMDEYHKLLAKKRDENEEARFRELRQTLKTRIPSVAETPAEQKAMGLIETLLQSEDDGKYSTVNERLLKQAEQLFDEVSKRRK
jgi:predicted ATPase